MSRATFYKTEKDMVGKGLVICMTDRTFPVDENNYMVHALILCI